VFHLCVVDIPQKEHTPSHLSAFGIDHLIYPLQIEFSAFIAGSKHLTSVTPAN